MAWQATGSARPSKAMSWLSAVVGMDMILTVASFFFSPLLGGIAFVALWILVVLSIVSYHVLNATSQHGVPHFMFDVRTQSTEKPRSLDFDDRLRDLHKLKADGLVSEEEFNRKRADILNEDW